MQLREQLERIFKQNFFLFLRMQKRTVDPGALRGAEIAAVMRVNIDGGQRAERGKTVQLVHGGRLLTGILYTIT